MTNEAYTLMETNRDRAIVRRSARYKKGGSKSKKCNLGHENLTKKELEKMNGECVSWKLTKFYTWEEFKKMPDDIQVEYLNYMLDTYKVGLSTISREVFKISNSATRKYLFKHDILKKIHERPVGGCIPDKDRKRFKEAIAEARKDEFHCEKDTVTAADIIPDTEAYEPVEIPKYEPIEQPFQHTNAMIFSTEYVSNKIDYDMLYSVEHMFRGKKLKVSFMIEAV